MIKLIINHNYIINNENMVYTGQFKTLFVCGRCLKTRKNTHEFQDMHGLYIHFGIECINRIDIGEVKTANTPESLIS